MFKLPPKFVQLSENFRLSDFLGCHSVYMYGHANDHRELTAAQLEEAKHLCTELLEPILARFGPVSLSYGYISPELSRKIVKYQDPDKPSYHRWDYGAAVDLVFHDRVAADTPPILTAHEIDALLPYSRMITYSESPFICLATRASEYVSGVARRAFYENRFEGVPYAKPAFVTKSKTSGGRKREHQDLLERGLPVHWKGAGYSTYHCGGQRQLHDYRTSRYSVLTDFLYNETAVQEGIPNSPPLTKTSRAIFKAAGETYDALIAGLEAPRLSVVEGYTSIRVRAATGQQATWSPERFQFAIALPQGRSVDDVISVVGDGVVGHSDSFVTIAGRLEK